MSDVAVLFVEGADDQHVVWSLLKQHNVPKSFEVIDKKGIDNILESIPVQLKTSGIQQLGVMVDADADLDKRWTAIKKVLSDAGYQSVPDSPDPGGTIINEADLPTFGAWIMPDNKVPGMLEDFIQFLVPTDDDLLLFAKRCTRDVPKQNFKEAHRAKAEIHAWLAWQEDPGTPLGFAITKKYLSADSQNANRLIEWITRLFIGQV